VKRLIPFGAWAALILGVLYLLLFGVYGGQPNLATAVSFFALSLSIKAYGHAAVKSGRRKRA
jgi:hypothetical protein